MTENFQQLFEESLKSVEMNPGAIITGVVIDIDKDWVTVHAGLKSEGVISADQFYNDKGELDVTVGDEVQVALEAVEDGFGATKLSREKARRAESWIELEAAHKADEVVIGVISGKVKGGFTVDVRGLRAFLPGSLVDVRPLREITHLENIDLGFWLKRVARFLLLVNFLMCFFKSCIIMHSTRSHPHCSLQTSMDSKCILSPISEFVLG